MMNNEKNSEKELSPEEEMAAETEIKEEAETEEEIEEEIDRDEETEAGKQVRMSKKDLKKMLADNEKLTAALADSEDKYKRMLAEYDNFRRRSAKEKEGVYTEASFAALKEILPVIDNLERALAFAGEDADDKLGEGVRMTLKQFGEALNKLGVEEIPALGQTFDPNFHDAVMHDEDETKGENEVTAVLLKGYRKGDRVLRCAMVKVSN